MTDKKIAIAADNPEVYSQTFILRHINELANGNTAVILTKKRKLITTKKPTFFYLRTHKFWAKIKRIILDLKTFKFRSRKRQLDEDLKYFIDTNDIGFVLAEFGYIGVQIFASVAKNKIPMFCYFRGSDASRKLTNKEYVSKLKKMMQSIDGIVAVSQSLIDNLKKVGVEHSNTFVIPSGVDTKTFIPTRKDNNLIVAVGRFVEKKAPHVTIQAFAIALKSFPNIRMEMVGDGDTFEDCIHLAQKLGVEKNIIFHGAKNHDYVKNLLSKASIFVQHSVTAENGDTEGMPTAIQEAMSSGCVVVSTNHAGIPEHIKNQINGMIVEEGDLNEYAKSIVYLLNDVKNRNSMSKNARKYATEYFDYKVNYSKLEKLIQNEIKKIK